MEIERRLCLVLIFVVGATSLGGCASGGGSGGVLSDTDLTTEELATVQHRTVYDFLRAHSRARFVSVNGNEQLTVYNRGTLRGPDGALLIVDEREVRGNVTQVLRQMRLSRVASLKILRPTETSARYGGGGRVGAVVIVTKDSDGG